MTGELDSPTRLSHLGRTDAGPGRFAAAERHRRRVGRLRVVLPALAVLCVGAIVVSLIVNQRSDVHVAGGGAPGIEMHAPVLKGTGQNGKPYEVIATEASQSHDGTIALTDVEARIQLEDGLMTVKAKSGLMHPDSGETTVTGGVTIDLGGIYRFATERAKGSVKTGVFTGDAPVRVEGPMGTIDAAGFIIDKSLKRVTFINGTSVIDPKAEAPKPAAPPESPK